MGDYCILLHTWNYRNLSFVVYYLVCVNSSPGVLMETLPLTNSHS
jgi:hypothetical protein